MYEIMNCKVVASSRPGCYKILDPLVQRSKHQTSFYFITVQRVPALRVFWDLEKNVLHEIRVSGTVLWSPTNANSPTYTYISQKPC